MMVALFGGVKRPAGSRVGHLGEGDPSTQSPILLQAARVVLPWVFDFLIALRAAT